MVMWLCWCMVMVVFVMIVVRFSVSSVGGVDVVICMFKGVMVMLVVLVRLSVVFVVVLRNRGVSILGSYCVW